MEGLTGRITAMDEFLFEQDEGGPLPEQIYIPMAQNARPGVQVSVKTGGNRVVFSLEGAPFHAEWFEMRAVPVEYNTGSGEEQGGDMVILPEKKPDYAVRKAPFRVYDCLKPIEKPETKTLAGECAAYFCISLKEKAGPGDYSLTLQITAREGVHICELKVRVYPVWIPEGNFKVTNWFSLSDIGRFHQAVLGTEKYERILKKYVQAMRRAGQTMFYLEPDQRCIVSREPYRFDFSYLKRTIELFFGAGMDTLEIGPLLSRGFLPDGLPDMYTAEFRCAAAPDVPVESPEGYEITSLFLKALSDFLIKNGWEKKVVFHIHDEPDVHVKNEQDLKERKRQYFYAVSLLKKYLHEAKVIEAVKTTEFKGGIDIWVPVTSSFEEQKAAFEELIKLGEEVWNYVCCVPQGKWLNRFLDDAVIHSRLLFWGFSKYGIRGYLHWGFNIFQMGMDPFAGTSCPNHTGIGTNFPCGDSFIVYPGEDGPWLSMRLEEQRRGVEDAELFLLLKKKDRARCDALIGRIFTDNQTYVDDPEKFREVYEDLLRELAGFSCFTG